MKKALKRSLSFLLAITIIFGSAYVGLSELDFSGLFVVRTHAASVDDLTFTLNDDGESYSVTNCYFYAFGVIEVPSLYNGLPVTSIERLATPAIVSIIIPDSVTNIGENAFYGCNSLDSIIIPKSVVNIGNNAFGNCWMLHKVFYSGSETDWANMNIGEENDYLIDSPIHFNAVDHKWVNDFCDVCGTSVWDYNYENDEITIIKYNGSESDVEMPSTIDGFPVTKIFSYAFHNCVKIHSVKIPDSVTIIGYNAFENCTRLESITIPNSVTTIENGAFRHCKSLVSITIPDSVTSIGSGAFEDTGYYNDESNWENGVLYINNHLIVAYKTIMVPDEFGGMPHSQRIDLVSGDYTVRQGTKTIADCALISCDKLTSIVIPDSVINIGVYAFSSCDRLTTISVDNNNTVYSSVEGVLFNKDKTSLIAYPCGKTNTSYIIPDGVTAIGYGSFVHCQNIENITMPEGVTSIEERAFSECSNIRKFIIPDGVTSIGFCAFYDCKNLEEITIPKTVTSKANGIFIDCWALKSVFYSGTEEEWVALGIGCNDDSEEIKNAIIHYNVTDHVYGDLLTDNATCDSDGKKYYQCSVCDYIKLIETLSSTGHNFENDICKNCGYDFVSSIASPHPYENDMNETWTIYKEGADHICITFSEETEIEDNDYIYIYNANNEELGRYSCNDLAGRKIGVLGDTVKITFITDGSVTYYGFSLDKIETFYEACSHDETEIIGAYDSGCVFSGYSGDTYCVECKCFLSKGEEIPALGHSMVNDVCERCNAPLWEYWIYNGKATVSKYNGNESHVVIPDNFEGHPVTKIGLNAFNGCKTIESVAVPNSVTIIDIAAFKNCTNLVSINIPDGVTEIWANAFEGCSSLKSIVIPDGVTLVDYEAFKGCNNLTSIRIPDTITDIGAYAFYNTGYYNDESNWENGALYMNNYLIAADVEGVYEIKPGTKIIAGGAFRDCTKLTGVNIPDSVVGIGTDVFRNCTNLADVTIPDSVTVVSHCAFYNCTSLTSITIPDGVTTIGNSAFYDCRNLTSITIPDSVDEIYWFAFYNTGYYNNESNWDNNVLYIDNHLIDAGRYNADEDVYEYAYGDYTVKEGTRTIAWDAFSGCGELTSISFPDSLIGIGGHSFEYCNSLTSVIIPDGVTKIREYAFNECDNLTSVTIPASVKWIGTEAMGYYYDWENDGEYKKVENFTIYGASCSAANKYADENDFNFISTGVAHDLSDWIIDTPATCTENGSKHRECTYCGDEVATEVILNLGHNYSTEWTIDKPATCTEDGSKSHHCTECGDKVDVTTISANGHTSSDWIIVTETSAEAPGKKHKECIVCGGVLETEEIPQLKPTTPKLTSVTRVSNGVKVTWGEVEGADSYIVYRKTSKSGWTNLGTTTENTFTDTKAKTGTTYYYTVKAQNEAGASGYNKTGLKIKFVAAPKLTKIANESSGVRVYWSKVSGADGYYLYRRVAGSKSWTKVATIKKGSTTSYLDKKASGGKTYEYIIKCYDGSTPSASAAKVIKIKRLTVPKLVSTSSSKTGITFKWGRVAGAEGYYVYRKTGSGSWVKLTTVKGNTKVSYVDKSAKKGKTYTYTVKAYSGSYTSAYNTKGLKIKDKY